MSSYSSLELAKTAKHLKNLRAKYSDQQPHLLLAALLWGRRDQHGDDTSTVQHGSTLRRTIVTLVTLATVATAAGCGSSKSTSNPPGGDCSQIQAQIDRAKANPTGQPQKVVDAYIKLAKQLQQQAGC